MFITKNTPKETILELAPACSCNQCKHGCRMGSGILAKGDIEKLAAHLNLSVEETSQKFLEETEQFNQKLSRPKILRQEKPWGTCIFFDEEKGCTVHEAKPLQCKIAMGCKDYGDQLMQWFMLNHIININDPESVRQYAQYLRAGNPTIHGGQLKDLITDEKKLIDILKYSTLK